MTKINPNTRISSSDILNNKHLKKWEYSLSSINNTTTNKQKIKVSTENNNKIFMLKNMDNLENKKYNICEKTTNYSREKIFDKESNSLKNVMIDN